MSEEVRNVNYVGIDIGSTASKVVVRGTSDMQFVLPTGWSSKETTQTIKEKLKENDVDVLGDETKVVATGYGRIAVDFADYVITENRAPDQFSLYCFCGIRSYQLYWRRQKQGGYRSRCCGLCCDEGSAACYAKGNDRPCHPDRRTESQRIFYKTPF